MGRFAYWTAGHGSNAAAAWTKRDFSHCHELDALKNDGLSHYGVHSVSGKGSRHTILRVHRSEESE
jgi:hypothetical protein